jgi:hypothetical protein
LAKKVWRNRPFRRLIGSKRALALPVTFLMLFVSTVGIISVTYYLAVTRINTQSQALNASTAKQSMISLDNGIVSTLWQPGSSVTFTMPDSGGLTSIQPSSNLLTIAINDSSGIQATLFNSPVGQVAYEIPYLGSMATGLYLEGDSQTISDQTGASLSQLYVGESADGPQIQLSYRPIVTYANAGLQNGAAVTDIRIYVVNLNSSDTVSLEGALPFKISCIGTQLTTQTYQVPNQPETLTVTAQLNGACGTVSIPISILSGGAVINIQTVVANISIQRCL